MMATESQRVSSLCGRLWDGWAGDFDGEITNIQVTGLLFSCELNSSYKAYGVDSLEEYMRMNGIGAVSYTHLTLPTILLV